MKKKRISPVVIVCVLIVLVAVSGVISLVIHRYTPTKERQDPETYFHTDGKNQAAIVINDRVLKKCGLYRDGEIYIPYDEMEASLDTNFYYEESSGEILLTTAKETLTLKADDPLVTVASGAPAAIRSEEGSLYLALEFVKDNAECTCEIYDDPPRAVLRTAWDGVRQVKVKENTQIRVKGGIKSRILTDVKAGDVLTYVEDVVDWSRVVTKDGYVGYIENDKLGSKSADTWSTADNVYNFPTVAKQDKKINLAWHQVTAPEQNQALSASVGAAAGLNTVSPTWFSIKDENGTISSLADKAYVDTAHGKGIAVWGLIDNFGKNIRTGEVLKEQSRRAYIISQLLAYADMSGMDGINVDFEQLDETDIPQFLQFLRELTQAAHRKNLVISVDNPVVQNYNMYYRRAAQGRIADYIIVMGYDEHYSGSEEAGSVASLSFVKNGFSDTLKEVPKEKVIGGIPFYTRLWTEKFSADLPESEVYGMDGADAYLAAHGMTKTWDDATGQYTASREDKTARYSIWLEEERSIEEKMKVISKLDLAGSAAWKLGFERSSVWAIINQYLTQ